MFTLFRLAVSPSRRETVCTG